ncbi:50S ribosomal protein L34 [Armadillidium vulgare]|nr:50S ribosomal protein L34 [Armadillidium vulgare]
MYDETYFIFTSYLNVQNINRAGGKWASLTRVFDNLILQCPICFLNIMNTFGNLLRFPIKLNLGNIFRSSSTAVRAHGLFHRFQNPSELKRIRKHGYKARLRTKAGREIIMRRILKGRHCLTH